MKLLSFIGANGPTWGAVVGQDDVIDLGKEMPQHANLAAYIGSGDYLKAQDHVVGKKPSAKLGAITFLPVIPEPEKIEKNTLGNPSDVQAEDEDGAFQMNGLSYSYNSL